MLQVSHLTPLQRLALRFAVISLIFYGMTALEGMIMQAHKINYELLDPDHYFAIMGAHPMVGIFGSSFMLVFGAFYFLVPTLMKKTIYSQRLAELTWILMTVGVGIVWLSGFLFRYEALYTNYWPLPVSKEFSPYALGSFAIGNILIMSGIFVFCHNLFATIFYQRDGKNRWALCLSQPLALMGLATFFVN